MDPHEALYPLTTTTRKSPPKKCTEFSIQYFSKLLTYRLEIKICFIFFSRVTPKVKNLGFREFRREKEVVTSFSRAPILPPLFIFHPPPTYLFDFSFCLFELDAMVRNYFFFLHTQLSDFRYLKYVLLCKSEMQKVERLGARKNASKKMAVAKHRWRDNELPQRKDEQDSFFYFFRLQKAATKVLKELHATVKFLSCFFFWFRYI